MAAADHVAPPRARSADWRKRANWLLPGVGCVATGATLVGLTLAAAFSTGLSLLLMLLWVVPDEASAPRIAGALALAVASWAASQAATSRGLRRWHAASAESARRAELCAVEELLRVAGPSSAAARLQAYCERVESDLPALARLAELHEMAGDAAAAQAAWRRVRKLDRHGLYRLQTRRRGVELTAQD